MIGQVAKLPLRAENQFLGGRMVNVIVDEQGDEHVSVEKNGHRSSSSNRLTSSEVMVLPRCVTGRPVRVLRVTSPELPELSPRRMSPATVLLSD